MPPVPQAVRLGDTLKALWPQTPGVVVDVLSPLSFAELRVVYDSRNGFGISGAPDFSGVPVLRCVTMSM